MKKRVIDDILPALVIHIIIWNILLVVFVHELGHYLVITVIGVDNAEIHITQLSTIYSCDYDELSDLQKALISSAGSISTLIFSIVWAILFRLSKDHPILKFLFGSLIFSYASDFPTYIISNLVFGSEGDWRKIMELDPKWILIFIVFATGLYLLIYHICFGFNFKKESKKKTKQAIQRLSQELSANLKPETVEEHTDEINFDELDEILDIIEFSREHLLENAPYTAC